MPLKCKYSKPAITIFILVVQGSVWNEQQEGAPQSRSLTKESSVRNISTSTIHGPQEGLRQDLACSFMGNHGEVQHQCWPYLSHQTPLWQGHKCSPFQRQHRRLVPNNRWSPTGMSTLTHPLPHIFHMLLKCSSIHIELTAHWMALDKWIFLQFVKALWTRRWKF